MHVDSRGGEKRLVLHVVESYAGGVRAAVEDYVRNAPDYRHALLFSARADAPLVGATFDAFEWAAPLPTGHLGRLRAVRKWAASEPGTIVHAHSSFAGFYTRIALRAAADQPIVYTPHCYAFERRDISTPSRAMYRSVEWVLSLNTSVFAACSARELQLSRWPWSRARATLLPNVAATAPVDDDHAVDVDLVVGAGRAGPQKDPDFFLAAVETLRSQGHDVRAVWIGGDEDLQERFGSDVQVTGWVDRDTAASIMASARLYLHSARWEGFPVAILEAAALNVPVAVRDIPSFSDSGLPLVVDSAEDVGDIWASLASNDARQDAANMVKAALSDNTDDAQRRALSIIYGERARDMAR